ncbi:cyclic nucleotide-binding domain-containing protein [Oscillatoria salina]|uniref:cyclic nucleotide-binding domain-containing protein n=1 Tax=Oscillatoria salina TaxID=331517 RepID=UPI0013BA11DF|nr:cyclic nucleotide-binding domain-containing protein [Oscillatoria salina]MBZ8183276.1 mechanosensitive ion channel [Oscillatoria salina IIICB1]NET89236.1 mechanosensitive ion channel [Kamptonema sp. SIO1D9]
MFDTEFIEVVDNWLNLSLFTIGDTEVSFSSIVKVIAFLLLVFFLSRLLKAFLKNRLLKRLVVDKANREAIATIISYSFGTLGCIIVLQANGFDLASLAVIAGGLGVGIGFGLQSVTKNFVSGITILLERSLRVDDFIEFCGLSGYIKEISLRSTRIRTRDGTDVIVPNSELVENQVVNLSYDSLTARIKIPVSVAYGSDPVLVTEMLLKSAYMEPAVVFYPTPQVIFKGFGDSALNFELWTWINPIDKEPQIKSSLNFIIEYNLRSAAISIPFPQRDLWIKNLTDLSILTEENNHDRVNGATQLKTPVTTDLQPISVRSLLPQVTYFQNFTELELRQLIEVGCRKRLRESEILFHEGDPGDAFYIVLSGAVEVYTEKINKHLASLGAGQFFGELALMLGVPRTASVRAKEETILFGISQQGFEKLLHEHPELAEVIVEELGKHQEELAQRQEELRRLGLVDAAEDDKNLILWVRKRLKNLFSL